MSNNTDQINSFFTAKGRCFFDTGNSIHISVRNKNEPPYTVIAYIKGRTYSRSEDITFLDISVCGNNLRPKKEDNKSVFILDNCEIIEIENI